MLAYAHLHKQCVQCHEGNHTPTGDTLQSSQHVVCADFLILDQPFSPSWAASTGGTLPDQSSCSLGAFAVVDAGTPEAEVHDSASEVQLASKTSESQKPLIRPVTDLPQGAASMTDDAKTSSSQESNTVSTASQSGGSQQDRDTELTSMDSSSSNFPSAQDGIKRGVDDHVTGKGDAESREPGGNIPAAHQLRALSAGRCLCLLLFFPTAACPSTCPASCYVAVPSHRLNWG